MSSSPDYPEREAGAPRPAIFFADAGISPAVPAERDAFEALDDLMSVVEQLCPSWPRREPFGPMHHLRL